MLFAMLDALGKASWLEQKGQSDEALQLLERAAQHHPNDPRYSLQQSQILARLGRYEEAKARLAECLKQEPGFAPAHLFAGVLALDCGDPTSAEIHFSEVANRQPSNSLAHAYLGLALLTNGKEGEGRTLLKLHGQSDNVGFLIRLTEWAESQWLEAGRFFAPRRVELQPPVSVHRMKKLMLTKKAERLFYQRRYREFLELAEVILARRPNDESFLFAAGVAAEMLCDYERALGYWSAIEADESDGYDPLRAAQGRVWVRLGEYDRAMDAFSHVTILGPEDYGVNYFLGVLCLAHSDRPLARRFFQRAFTQYLVDTLEYQFAHTLREILSEP
ncbi:MAG: tetratricopeptide repeat protein [Candidatus Sumerlaea chitinivorans]|nr:tetratricopeptide repeat protein [Candidatus Sumerlaea chitinivorans]